MSDSESVGSDDGEIVSLSKKSQLFLQAAISRRCFSERDAIAMHRICCTLCEEEVGHFADFVEHISKAIEPYNLSMKKRRSESDGTLYYAVVNMKSDLATELATELAPNEIKWFRLLVERIITAPNMAYCVGRAVPFEISRDIKPAISKTDTQALLAALVLKGWLAREAERNIYSLSTRSILELESYLVEEFPDELEDAECGICQELVFEGLQCPGEDCSARMHIRCRQRSLAGNQPRSECSMCETPWPANAGRPIGLKALDVDAGESEDELLGESMPTQKRKSQRQPNGKVNGEAKRRGKVKMQTSNSATSEDDEEDGFEQAAEG